ncbi:DUF6129 family protein [Rhabdochromatium marinum]|uniref:DUF6129 family protein n=1 Tax=Rhabdochromatium marinum TaxID=48729 RepID=UPI0019085ABC|nr:DUF6129 family protein [Rhabdochromatium marinum]MBK1649070.1 hypothetical protein [Rhabdochromatium marinum]
MIPVERIDQIVTIVERAGLNPQTLGALRDALPELHFTQCLDDEVGSQPPVRTAQGFNLYLVEGSSGHCLRMTDNPDHATGVVLAETDAEDADNA